MFVRLDGGPGNYDQSKVSLSRPANWYGGPARRLLLALRRLGSAGQPQPGALAHSEPRETFRSHKA